ncbi:MULTISPECIES: gluconate:H+ symporter [unclassified Arcicella]|uniref:gluconate:H+ symporter n=1 Tax=unclassified Arcicella TaxID=2644986 RepID=UPI002864B904|nr:MULTISPECIES: gluconate:H+ symporter [unclassified Arcicella]MDR6563088.1 Gnt-I system high-affinity gluconate transporter [Arcicella sp. BE51]MDR6811761.1 Gnt-I system high-affinity gluconate transporter [Arcicella sp. BE140]MDR6823286.1 Gnt-I system high-affinity gluconate transporter [Arcicella sp. BE139]
MTLFIIFLCIGLLVLLITWGKLNPFLAFLIVSIVAGITTGIPLSSIGKSLQKGVGDMLGSLIIVIALGAMLGKIVAESGAAQKIASVMMKIFGRKYIQWGLVCTGFIIGIPLFYNVGFVLMIPLIFSVVNQYKLPAVYIGLPMLASLSVAHGFLPPHPSPAALVAQFNADMGLTLVYGIIIAIPTIIIAGPIFSLTLKKIPSTPLETFQSKTLPEDQLPSTLNSFLTSLLPVILLASTTLLSTFWKGSESMKSFGVFIADPSIVMLISVIVATFTLGRNMGTSMKTIMSIYTEAVKDVSMIVLIIGGAGALKQILIDGGVSNEIAIILKTLPLNPLILGWLVAAIIRVCLGSATVAGLTTAGIMAPLVAQSGVNPNLMVLSIGVGSLMFSHVNDPGFWLFKEYFNLSIKNTIKSWSMMESIVAVVGLAGVLILNAVI